MEELKNGATTEDTRSPEEILAAFNEAALAVDDENEETSEATEETTSLESTAGAESRVRMTDKTPKKVKKTSEEKETPMAKLSFADRAATMGLTAGGDKGVYNYSDQYSKVAYKTLYTSTGEEIPLLGIFTSPPDKDEYKYISYVSDSYEFVGNGTIVDKIKQCIKDDGEPIVDEYPTLSPNLCQLYDEIVISNATNVPKVGDVYPQIIISNSYNGTKAVNIVFGLSISNAATKARWGFGFRTKIGIMKQIHVKSSETTLRTGIGSYVKGFKENIVNMIESNFNRKFTEDDVFSTLELVEKLGKKKRDEVSALVDELSKSGNNDFWSLFNVIVKYSTEQKNINTKMYLENVAERMLVLPEGMLNLVK